MSRPSVTTTKTAGPKVATSKTVTTTTKINTAISSSSPVRKFQEESIKFEDAEAEENSATAGN